MIISHIFLIKNQPNSLTIISNLANLYCKYNHFQFIFMSSKAQDFVPEKIQEALFNDLLHQSANLQCADCNNKGPTWASIDFGVFICIRCSGM